jgi:hypothetical protein
VADRAKVEGVATPAGTDTWYPIPHKSLIDLIAERLPQFGMTVVQEQHALMREDHRYFGLFQLKPADGESTDYGLVLGVRNSHDKSFPAGLCLGAGVFVCDNLAFSAEVVIGRRHTRHIMDDLPRLIAAALGKLVTARVDQEKRIEAYKHTEICRKHAADMLMTAFENKAVKPTQMAHVWEQWLRPNHPEFAANGNTAWRLFNAFTEVSKGIQPFELASRTQRLHPIFDVACGIQIGAKTSDLEGIEDAEFTVKGANEFAD